MYGWTVFSLIILTIFHVPSDAVPRHRYTAKNDIINGFIEDINKKWPEYDDRSSEKLINRATKQESKIFSHKTNEQAISENKNHSERSLLKRGIYDLNGPSEEKALMEYYASMLVTDADPADRPILKEKLSIALEMEWSDFQDFKNYCDKLVDKVTSSVDIVTLDKDFDLADHLYSLLEE